MSNTYYKYKKTQTDKEFEPGQERTVNMEMTLTAYVGGSPNCIQLTLQTDDKSPLSGIAYITLTENEQDDLIHAIYERRGLRWCGGGTKPQYKEKFFNYVQTNSISATGNEQSQIHPNND